MTSLNYAAAAALNSSKWIECYLQRDNPDDDSVTYSLTRKELGNLIFNKLGLPKAPGVIKTIDENSLKVIRIEVSDDLDVDKYKNNCAIQVKEGLKVLPMKEIKREKWVKIQKVPSTTRNEDLAEVLSLFGEIVQGPEVMKMEVPENEVDELTLLLRNIQGTDRQVNMIINKNIPSYISLEERKEFGIMAKTTPVQDVSNQTDSARRKL